MLFAFLVVGCATVKPIPHPANGQVFQTEQQKAAYCRIMGKTAIAAYDYFQTVRAESPDKQEEEKYGMPSIKVVFLSDWKYDDTNGNRIKFDADSDIAIDGVDYAYSDATSDKDAFMHSWEYCMNLYGGY